MISRLKRLLRWFVLVLLLFMIIIGVLFWHVITPATPSAFYTPPDPLPAGEPGTIIRSEPITHNLPEGAVAWRVLYLSTGIHGEPIAVSGVVIAPEGESASPRPVVAWAHGSVGVLPECGISHSNNPFNYIAALHLMIRKGFIVVATDYPGHGTPGIHPYLVGPVEAYSVLDSVRSVRQLDVYASDRFVVWGPSQGGHASLWAAQTASEYAPEMTLVAAAASAPVIDLKEIFQWGLDKRSGSVLIAQAIYAWSYTYSDVKLDDVIKPEMRSRIENIAKICVTTPLAFLLVGDVPTALEFLIIDPLEDEPYKTITDNNTPRGRINVPLLILHGAADTLILIEQSEADAARRCAEGEDVQLVRYPGVKHDAVHESAIMTVGWIEDRFAGRATGSTCGH